MTDTRTRKSTTARFHLLQTGFRIGERFAPRAAGGLAGWLWTRLPAAPKHRRRAEAPVGGSPFRLDTGEGTAWGYTWGDGPTVHLVHGWGGSTGDFTGIAASLVANGYRVVSVDALSHGNSGPGRLGDRYASPLDLMAPFRAAVDRFGTPHAVVAHSLGCLTTVAALRDPIDVGRLVLISPFIGGDTFATMFSGVRIGPRVFAAFDDKVRRISGHPLTYFSLPEPAVDTETLIVHNRDDRMTPFPHSQRILDAWPRARLYPVSGMGHRRVLSNPDVVGRVVGFVD